MLRITTARIGKRVRIVLEGKLAPPWTTELSKEWDEVRSSATDRTLVVDLDGVTMISEEGERILIAMINEGARFVCKRVLNKHVLRRLQQQHDKRERNGRRTSQN